MTSSLATEHLPDATLYLAALRRREAALRADRDRLRIELREVRASLRSTTDTIRWLAPLCEGGAA